MPTVSDDFNRANGLLGANWTTEFGSGGFAVSSNQAVKTGTNAWKGIVRIEDFASDQVISCVYRGGNVAGVMGRMDSLGNGYGAILTPTAVNLMKFTAPFSPATLVSVTTPHVSGDIVELKVEGNSLQVRVNGVLRVDTTDASYASGSKAGIVMFGTDAALDDFSAQDITSDPPVAQSATIASSGTSLSVAFDKPVTGSTVITLSATGGAVTATYASGDETDTLVFTLSRTVESGESVTVDYSPGNIEDLTANALEAFSGLSVANNSTQDTSNPAVTSASVNTAGTQLTVVFTESVSGSTGFTLTAGAQSIGLTYLSGSGTNAMLFSLARPALSTETLTLAYSSGDIVDGASNALPDIASQAVTNNSTQAPLFSAVVQRNGVTEATVESATSTINYTPLSTGSYTMEVTRVSSGRSATSNAVSVV
jgi:hypothetical protein